MATTGIVRYDAMVLAINECHKVDEVKEIHSKARALEVYAQQAKNRDAERKASEVRIRAERRAGELLIEMKQNGQRHSGANPGPGRGNDKGVARHDTLSGIGITRDQSSKWQQLAAIPKAEFERAVTGSGPKPSTEGLVNAQKLKADPPAARMDPDALWFWGRLRDFERSDLFSRDPNDLIEAMTDSMRDDVSRIRPRLLSWLKRMGEKS